MRTALAALVILLSGAGVFACDYPGPAPDQGEARADGDGITWAGFSDATDRYPHGALGDAWEAGGLRAQAGVLGPCDLVVTLPETAVFEDVAPRLADVDGDGETEIVVVESAFGAGAALAVYGLVEGRLDKIAATPPIGLTNRWLSPVGIADLNRDGALEIAYIETPHLGKTLRIWTWRDGGLAEIARARGLTNHRFGEPFISGGVRACDGVTELITVDARWRRIVATKMAADNSLTFREVGTVRGAGQPGAGDGLLTPGGGSLRRGVA